MKEIKIFIASANDLQKERQDLEKLINTLNKGLEKISEIKIIPKMWENESFHFRSEKFQSELNKMLVDCEIVFFLFFTKFGKYTKKEWNTAIAGLNRDSGQKIFACFKIDETPIKPDSNFKQKAVEISEVVELKEIIANQMGQIYKDFKGSNELQVYFILEIFKYLAQLKISKNIQFDLQALPKVINPQEIIETPKIPNKNPKIIDKFIDNDDGTITDTETKLMWKKCSEGLSGKNCQYGSIKKFTWEEAFEVVKDANKRKDCGYDDWRLPTIDELRTIVEKSHRPTINPKVFPNTEADYYWASSPDANDSNYAWELNFHNGKSYNFSNPCNYYVRLVRAGQ